MRNFTRQLEYGFEVWGKMATHHPIKIILIIVMLTVVIASNLRDVVIDTSNEGLFHSESPALLLYEEFREQFGRDEKIILAIHPPDVFTEPFLQKFIQLHQALRERVPNLASINSLVNARSVVGTADALLVNDLMEKFIAGKEDIATFKKRVMGSKQYKNRLLSKDAKLATILLQMNYLSSKGVEDGADFFDTTIPELGADQPSPVLTDKEQEEVIRVVGEIVNEFAAEDFVIHIAGSTAVTAAIRKSMKKDMVKLTGIAVVIISILLFILFRRAAGVFIPIIIVLLSLIVTLGLYPLTGRTVTTTVIILPSFLLATGIAASVHILSIFFQAYDHGVTKEKAVIAALSHSGLPVLMASLTTAVGLWSFLTAELRSIANLGLFTGAGVLIVLVNTLILLPALISLLPLKQKQPNIKNRLPFLTRLLVKTGDYAVDNAWKVVIVAGLLVVISLVGVSKLVISHNPLTWFPDDAPIKIATELVDEKLKGSVSMEILVKTPQKDGVRKLSLLKKIDSFQQFLQNLKLADGSTPVGTTISLVDIVKEIHQALNENREEMYKLPENRELLAQEILLFENSGSDDLEDVTNEAFSLARINIRVPWRDAAFYVNFVREIEEGAVSIFGDEVEIRSTGLLLLFTAAISAITRSMLTSYMLAGVLITIMMTLLLSGFKKGLISMIPNLTPIIITMGLMGFLGVKLDMFILLIGSIAIGLAVDDTIHFMHKFYSYYGEEQDVKNAVRQALQTTGRAMLFTSIALVAGFWVFLTATLHNVYYFGLFTGITVLIAFLADILISPALMSLIYGQAR